jgi:hypothetical protein
VKVITTPQATATEDLKINKAINKPKTFIAAANIPK